jgi:hypothetical protein
MTLLVTVHTNQAQESSYHAAAMADLCSLPGLFMKARVTPANPTDVILSLSKDLRSVAPRSFDKLRMTWNQPPHS